MEPSFANQTSSLRSADISSLLVSMDWSRGLMAGGPVQASSKIIDDLKGIFRDESARSRMEPTREVYSVQWWSPVAAGSEGGLFWGVTVIHPGMVGNEYFMTHGHFHANRSRAEYYGTVSGKGMLIQMDPDRKTWGEPMSSGTLHYIRGEFAHRVANTSNEPLVFWTCWPSDAGYDYRTIADRGFGARLLEHNGEPVLVCHE